MSTIHVTIERIDSLEPHPNADRLEIAKLLGTQTVVPKGVFAVGDCVVFFPPDICLPPAVSAGLGVQKYLKHSLYQDEKVQCRVAATRLRGIPSYGFIIKAPEVLSDRATGTAVDEVWAAWKYEPPQRPSMQGDVEADPPNFPRYTDIQHYYCNTHAFPAGLPVRVTEKIHGTNCRFGLIKMGDHHEYLGGSHRHARKKVDANGRYSVYWEPLNVPGVEALLKHLASGGNGAEYVNDAILFGELFGPGIQDMTYGVPQGRVGFRVFDIMVNGRYLDWPDLHAVCAQHGVQVVPTLYVGPFDPARVQEWTNGPTLVVDANKNKSKFKGREGCVIAACKEDYDDILGRVIAKSVSADYLDRKGAQDNGDL